MELNRKVLAKVAVMLFLLGITATVEARSDARSFIKESLPKADASYFFVKSTTTVPCACTRSWPIYTCRCRGEECEPACRGTCFCVVNAILGTRNCKCADEITLLSRADAH